MRADFVKRVEQGTTLQEDLNRFPSEWSAPQLSVLAECQALSQGYEQYLGYFDWWFKVRVNEDIRTKMGQAFVAGDISIGTFTEIEDQKQLVVMSWRNGYVVTAVRLEDAEAY